eukprot:9126184-Heterocapsa_arctica.AAC.1
MERNADFPASTNEGSWSTSPVNTWVRSSTKPGHLLQRTGTSNLQRMQIPQIYHRKTMQPMQ